MRPFLTLLASILLIATAYGQTDVNYSIGKALIKEKKYDEAIQSLVKARPTDSTYANLGFAYIRKGDDKNALIALNKAIDLNADYGWAYGLRGYLYTKIDAPELSYYDLSRAIKLNTPKGELSSKDKRSPESDSDYVQRAQSYEYKNRHKKAAKDYQKAMELNPDNADAFYGLQDLYVNKGVKQKAVKNVQEDTTATEEQFTSLYTTQGATFNTREEGYALIIKDYTKIIALFPEVAAAYRDRAYLYIKLNKMDSAVTDLTSAINLDPQSAEALGYRGAIYVETKQPDLAIIDLNKAIKLNPSAYQYYNNRGLAYYQKGQYEQAIKDFSTLITMDTLNAAAYRHRGNLYTYANKPALAIADITKSISIDPENAESYAIRGFAHALSKNYESAIHDFTNSIKLDPSNGATYANRALAYKFQKNYKAAVKDFSTTIELAPDDAEAYKGRGEVYEQLGKKELAEADFKKAKTMERSNG